MKANALIFVHIAIAAVLFTAACSNPVKNKLQGSWTSKDGKIKLQITSAHFIMDDKGVIPEDYFIKGDTIFTSFEGNRPYTKFIIQRLEANNLTLIEPDSTSMEFSR